MKEAANTLAKFTRPRLHGAAPRERLFARLDEASAHKPAICVVGPPGAGKTTLVATWLDAGKLPGLWYQVDPGDTDVATFFYYLGEAAAPFAKKTRRKLPVLAPEYQHDIEGFSRRFFRELFSLLPRNSVLVLDNYQEVEAGQLFHQIVASAVGEIPEHLTLLAISRRDPPDCYARLIANENVGFVDWDDLRLTSEEARAIIQLRLADLSDTDAQRLIAESDGWAAGLTLMLENRGGGTASALSVPAGYDSIFNYFATQIFDRLPRATRSFIVSTSVLDQVPVSLARDLTGNSDASEILEDLHRRHFFTHRRPGTEPTYWYHALFRTFLKSNFNKVLSVKGFREIERKAARLLEARQDYDDAFQLFHDAGDWVAARRLIERHAQTLLAQGRGRTLRDWILTLPTGVVDDAPWLRYWLGTSLIPLDPAQARVELERAFAQFSASGEIIGQALSAAGVLDSYIYEWSDFKPMRRWVDTLASLHDKIGVPGNPGIERDTYTSLLVGMLYCAPDHLLLPHVVERVTEMLDENMDVNSKVSMAMTLLGYSNAACDMERGKIAVDSVEPLLDHSELTPFNRVWWYLRKGYYLYVLGEYRAAIDALDHAASLKEQHGLQGLLRTRSLFGAYQIYCYAALGDVRSARKCLETLQAGASQERPLDVIHVALEKSDVECARSNFLAVVEESDRGGELAAAMGSPYFEIVSIERVAAGLAVLGDTSALETALRRLRKLFSGTCVDHLECQARYLEAYAEVINGNAERGQVLVGESIAYARSHDYQYPQTTRNTPVPKVIFSEALRMGVEVDYVTDTIRRLRIAPLADAPAAWPWPVKVHALGRFEIELDGQRLEFSGKAPRRVLALLKAIVAGGPSALPASHLVDTLWPDEEGDAGRKALEVCLVRLRKLLGHTEAVLVRDEQISLNRSLCWVDAWAFAELVEMIESGDEPSRATARLGTHALDLYRGNLLPADGENRTIIVARLKLRDLLIRLVSTLGRQMEDHGQWDEALACYRRGIDADELAEEFYQGVMRCHAATGRSAEGIATYRRLRQTLSVVLGLKPSTQTEQLAQLLREERTGPDT